MQRPATPTERRALQKEGGSESDGRATVEATADGERHLLILSVRSRDYPRNDIPLAADVGREGQRDLFV